MRGVTTSSPWWALRPLAAAAVLASAQPAVALAQGTTQGAAAMPGDAALAGFTPELVSKQFALGLPGLWRVDKFVSQGMVNAGNPVTPDIRTRFEAQVSLTADTYARDGSDGPVVFVRKVAPEGLQKVVYGTSASTLDAGTWTTRITLQNPDVLRGLGEPLAAIPGRVIVRGSPDEAAYLKQRDAAVQAAAQQALADAQRQETLAAAQRTAAAADNEAKRQQAQAAAVAAAQQQSAVEAVQAAARRQQAQLDEEAAAKLAETKTAGQQALMTRQKDELAAQQALLEARTRTLEALRTALQSPSRSDRLAAIDTALASDDPTVRSLGYDAAFGGNDPAAQNVALRRFFDAKRLIVFNVFAPSTFRQGEQPPLVIVSALGGMRLAIKEFDLASGRFSGDLLFGANLQWDAVGSIDRNTMSIAARGQGKPIPGLYGAPVSMAISLQLSPQKELDGFAQLGGGVAMGVVPYSPVIVRVNLD